MTTPRARSEDHAIERGTQRSTTGRSRCGDERHDLRTPDLLRLEACGVVSPRGDSALAASRLFEFMVVAVAVLHPVSRGLYGWRLRRSCAQLARTHRHSRLQLGSSLLVVAVV